jgi:hypothetical protein
MNDQQAGQGNSQHGDAAGTASVGHRTSGEAGATLDHETMAETGGSGGSGLTRSQVGQSEGSGGDASRQGEKPEECDSAMMSGARGFQDTRSRQAGGTGTGLGTPETGANQVPEDLNGQKP